jgi:hypothetical protein
LQVPGTNPPAEGDLIDAGNLDNGTPVFVLEERVSHYRVNTKDLPVGRVGVPVTVDDNWIVHETRMVVRSVGVRVMCSGETVEGIEGGDLDSLQLVSGWWIFGCMTKEERRLRTEEEMRRWCPNLTEEERRILIEAGEKVY